MNLFNKVFKTTFLFIFLAELLSLWGYLIPKFNKITFVFILILAIILTLENLNYGVWIILAELFISSKGYLFFFDFGGITISIRIALWLVVMSVWLGKALVGWIKNKKLEIEFLKSDYLFYFLALFVIIFLGVVNGFWHNNNFDDIFFDSNSWLYFFLVFPVFEVIRSREDISNILSIFTASIVWLSFKTFFLLFVFSHNLIGMVTELYRWVRVSGVGEITQMPGGFSRIFFQSHIFVLIGLFIFILLLSREIKTGWQKNKYFYIYLLSSVALFAVIVISFSRSFWVGMIFGLVCLFAYFLWQKTAWKDMAKIASFCGLVGVLGLVLIFTVIKFPYPRPSDINMSDILSERISNLNEAAVSSRWALLPELWKEIKGNPILGKGFGSLVTYQSSDPRVLESSATGEYSTYAFEWGWLDIWLKLGVLGFGAYLVLFGKALKDYFSQNNLVNTGLLIGLGMIFVVSFFSPYLNHPLGIGYLILVFVVIKRPASEETSP